MARSELVVKKWKEDFETLKRKNDFFKLNYDKKLLVFQTKEDKWYKSLGFNAKMTILPLPLIENFNNSWLMSEYLSF